MCIRRLIQYITLGVASAHYVIMFTIFLIKANVFTFWTPYTFRQPITK